MLRKALVIGSNGPDNYGQLQHAVSDSIRIADVLGNEKYCFEVSRLESGTDPSTVLNRLTTIAKSCNRQDTLIFYFSGHGECRDGDLFLLLDTTEPENLPLSALPISWIIQTFNHCKAENKLLVLDCCYADAGRNTPFKSGGIEPVTNQPISAFQKITVDPQNYIALLAGDHLEKTREIEIEHKSSKLQGGFLTVHIYLALTDRFDEVDGDDDGKITVDDLKNWLFIQANEYNNQRTKEHHIPRPMLRGRTEGPFYLNLQSNSQEKETVRSMDFPQKFLGDYTHLTYDRCPVLSYRLEDLDSELVENFLKQPQAQRLLARHKISQINREEHLKEIGVINNDGQITLGSFLCFAPRQLLTDKFAACSLHTVIYGGKKRGTARLKHSEVIRGNLLYLFTVGMQFLRAEAGLQTIGEIGTDKRDELEIPEIALREALANAIVHRDYQSDALKDQPTRIEVYPDRVEITSYGGLLDGVSEDDLNNNPEQVKPFRRNHIVAEIFRIMQNAELNASGISRMHEATQQVDLPFPHISQSNERCTVTTVTVVFTRRQFSSLLKQLNYEDLNDLVQEVRLKTNHYVQQRCGMMRVLDMASPILVDSIYTDLNILEISAGRQRLEIDDLLQNSNLDDFDRFGLGRVSQQQISGFQAVEQYSKLMLLGKPGSGKTTFLKHLAISCISGQFQSDCVPIFVNLNDFAERLETPSLLDYIALQFSSCSVQEPKLTAEAILSQGKGLILLDGLDEIREENRNRTLKDISSFSSEYYSNKFVVTCRIAAREYTFAQFTEVEVADFDFQAIKNFAQKWFKDRGIKTEKFIQRLQENPPIQELATNPLLLTMLCLVFEELADFPSNRAELYEEGLNILLKKWDGQRNIQRDQIYKSLSAKRKEDLLSQIAFTTFERGEYFFRQKEIERKIQNYICALPDANTEPEALRLDSESVLKSIEAQNGLLVERARGIYSFSHMTFHEYFAARKIVNSFTPEPLLKELAVHITEKRWREIFLLTIGMSHIADPLLLIMKSQIDSLLVADANLQKFLTWVDQKSQSMKFSDSLVDVRKFYFSLSLSSINSSLEVDRVFLRSSKLNSELELDLDMSRCLTCALKLNSTFDHVSVYSLTTSLDRICIRDFNLDLKHQLQQLIEQLPHLSSKNEEDFKTWWQSNGFTWTEQLRTALIEYRNIGHDWQFSSNQLESLRAYYDATKLLIDCLNSKCFISRDVRSEIENTLLLPVRSPIL
jgi:predicted HTH transcriptional regulator